MIKTKGVAHFTIPVSNVVASEKFYTEVLGMKVTHGSAERGMIFLDSGGDCIILAKTDGPISPVRFPDVHHAFVVDSDTYADSVQELKDQGIEVFREEDRQGGAVNGPRCYFHDPDGNVLEIIDLTSYIGAA